MMYMTGIVLREFATLEAHAVTAMKILAPGISRLRARDRMGTSGAMVIEERRLPLGVENRSGVEGGIGIAQMSESRLLPLAESAHFMWRHGVDTPRHMEAIIAAPSTDQSTDGKRRFVKLCVRQEGLWDLHGFPFPWPGKGSPRRGNGDRVRSNHC